MLMMMLLCCWWLSLVQALNSLFSLILPPPPHPPFLLPTPWCTFFFFFFAWTFLHWLHLGSNVRRISGEWSAVVVSVVVGVRIAVVAVVVWLVARRGIGQRTVRNWRRKWCNWSNWSNRWTWIQDGWCGLGYSQGQNAGEDELKFMENWSRLQKVKSFDLVLTSLNILILEF